MKRKPYVHAPLVLQNYTKIKAALGLFIILGCENMFDNSENNNNNVILQQCINDQASTGPRTDKGKAV